MPGLFLKVRSPFGFKVLSIESSESSESIGRNMRNLKLRGAKKIVQK
jgi:hypothetical protein